MSCYAYYFGFQKNLKKKKPELKNIYNPNHFSKKQFINSSPTPSVQLTNIYVDAIRY